MAFDVHVRVCVCVCVDDFAAAFSGASVRLRNVSSSDVSNQRSWVAFVSCGVGITFPRNHVCCTN
jgi:hypothetical protein